MEGESDGLLVAPSGQTSVISMNSITSMPMYASHVEPGPADRVVVASVVGGTVPVALLVRAVKMVPFFEMPGPSDGDAV
jgi:hypothetical protein